MGRDGLARILANARAVARQTGACVLGMVECRGRVFGRIIDPAQLRSAPSGLVA